MLIKDHTLIRDPRVLAFDITTKQELVLVESSSIIYQFTNMLHEKNSVFMP